MSCNLRFVAPRLSDFFEVALRIARCMACLHGLKIGCASGSAKGADYVWWTLISSIRNLSSYDTGADAVSYFSREHALELVLVEIAKL